MMKHEINFLTGGFAVPSIIKCSDKKLSKLEEDVADQLNVPVDWANIDDLGYLSVAFNGNTKILLNEDQKQIVQKIIDKSFK